MMQRRREMMDHHEQMMARWKSMQSELDQKIAKMNQATGQDKVDAIADVISTLVAQRNEIVNYIAGAHKRMMDGMQDSQGRMGGPPPEPGMPGANPPPQEQK
jgi:predicted phage gp36 major capsid-like protein